jgi:formylglycine-generating enzyme required for sulfatase activity/predicted Ser/Thr protein kinase/predicted esterase
MVGTTLLHYRIEARLGQGGMGTVYRARDLALERIVAIKVLDVSDPSARSRLVHEARAASALNHPNIVTIHGVEQDGDVAFIVMEHVEGLPLDTAIPAGGLPAPQAIRYALEMADAVAAAHAAGIVHRDIKPGNVMITSAGRVKVLDFGIARRAALSDDATRAATAAGFAPPGAIVGTPGYMAPEQIAGEPGDPAADVFAMGAVLFQMLTGRAPFDGTSTWTVMEATMHREAPDVGRLRPGTPPRLVSLIARALAKSPTERFASGRQMHHELAATLRAIEQPVSRPPPARRVLAIVALVAVAAIAAAVLWSRAREARLRWVRDEAIPQISHLMTAGEPIAAYRLGERARAAAPDDPQLIAVWQSLTTQVPVASDPEGAVVSIRSIEGKDEAWIALGHTPLVARVPFGQMRWRFELDGYESREVVPNPFPERLSLTRAGTGRSGLVHVPAGEVEVPGESASASLPEFWIETTEVTNRQFKAFADAGGYQNRDYWRQPFVDGGKTLSWQDAMARFRDTTGRPGPATWELGTFPDGAAELPVSGVSWYEAAAYAAFAQRVLPSVYHWRRAAGISGIFSDVLQVSNFGGRAPQPVGASGSLSPFGAADMAGNVKEWVWNESSGGRRFVLGGAWFEAPHTFHDEDARQPFTRDPGFGFRCMQQDAPVDAVQLAPIVTLERDPATLVPIGDELFAAYRRLYDYDARPLDARVDERDDSHADWITERVSLTAAYGGDRLPLSLMLPRAARPPYQVVLYFPGSDAVRAQSSRTAYTQWVQFLLRSGRAVAFPVYQQTYERRRQPTGANFLREISLQRGLDVRRTIDYLESRDDIDRSKIAIYGVSLGAQLAPVYLAIEPRLRAGVLLSGGFETWDIPAESDPVNFAPRVRQPVLMVNGRDDFDLPLDTAQVPLFKALGTPAADKRHAVLEGGHIPPRPQEVFKEILDWLDRYLGPVGR